MTIGELERMALLAFLKFARDKSNSLLSSRFS
jgi:hypothetical protein